MNTPPNHRLLTEAEIDNLVIAQADEDAAWEKPVQGQQSVSTSAFISAQTRIPTDKADGFPPMRE